MRPADDRLRKGQTLSERRAARREALLDAGLDLFGTRGYADTAVEEICRRSTVSTRNFYEEFDSKEALLDAVYEGIARRAHHALVEAAGTAEPSPSRPEVVARVGALVHALVDDLRVGRVAFIESRGVSASFEQRRQTAHRLFADFLVGRAQVYEGGDGDRDRRELFALGMVGAVNEVLTDWVLRDDRRPLDDVVEDLAEYFLAQRRLFDERPPG